MSAAEQLAKAFLHHIEHVSGGLYEEDNSDLRDVHIDGCLDLVALAEVALDFEPEEEAVDFYCPECGGHNMHEPDCVRGKAPVDTGALRGSITCSFNPNIKRPEE